jgi:hypothetical protein
LLSHFEHFSERSDEFHSFGLGVSGVSPIRINLSTIGKTK